MDIGQLLALWAEREPEQIWSEKDAYWVIANTQDWDVYPSLSGNFQALELAAIEYALREAIQARGWEWELDDQSTGEAFARISERDAVIHFLAAATHPEPAIALLMAYLKALGCEVEAVQEVG